MASKESSPAPAEASATTLEPSATPIEPSASPISPLPVEITQGDRPIPPLNESGTQSTSVSSTASSSRTPRDAQETTESPLYMDTPTNFSNSASIDSNISIPTISPTHIKHVSQMSNADMYKRMESLMGHIEENEGQTYLDTTHYGPNLTIARSAPTRRTQNHIEQFQEALDGNGDTSLDQRNVDDMTMEELKAELKRKRMELEMSNLEKDINQMKSQQRSLPGPLPSEVCYSMLQYGTAVNIYFFRNIQYATK